MFAQENVTVCGLWYQWEICQGRRLAKYLNKLLPPLLAQDCVFRNQNAIWIILPNIVPRFFLIIQSFFLFIHERVKVKFTFSQVFIYYKVFILIVIFLFTPKKIFFLVWNILFVKNLKKLVFLQEKNTFSFCTGKNSWDSLSTSRK